jgi:hypothetical protein
MGQRDKTTSITLQSRPAPLPPSLIETNQSGRCGSCRDGMGPSHPTNSLTLQSRPAPLPLYTFFRGISSILRCPIACNMMAGDVGNCQDKRLSLQVYRACRDLCSYQNDSIPSTQFFVGRSLHPYIFIPAYAFVLCKPTSLHCSCIRFLIGEVYIPTFSLNLWFFVNEVYISTYTFFCWPKSTSLHFHSDL